MHARGGVQTGHPGPFCPWPGSRESGSLGVVEMGAQTCVFQELLRCSDDFSGAREVGIIPVHGTDGQEETREKLCSNKLARGQAGEQASCVSVKAGLVFHAVSCWVSPCGHWGRPGHWEP